MSRVQLRRRRAEVLGDLPPGFASVIALDLVATQRAAYRKAEEKGTVWLRRWTGSCGYRMCSNSFSA